MNHLYKFILVHISIAFLVITAFVWLYPRPVSIIPLHLTMVTSLYVTVFYLSRGGRKYFRPISIVLFALLSSSIIFVYIANFLSNQLWNDNVSYSFILLFAKDLDILLENIPFGLLYFILIVIFFVIGLIWLYARYAYSLKKYDHNLTLKDTRIALFVTLAFPFYFSNSFDHIEPGIWDGEPLSSLAVRSNTISFYTDQNEEITFKEQFQLTEQQKKRPNIIIIHADDMRATHMSSMGYERQTTPYIESLVRDGADQVELGLSNCSESICGILSVLGSKYFKDIDKNTPLIQNYLKDEGYRVVFAGSGKLSWEGLDQIISGGVDYFFRSEFDERFSINDDAVILSALNKLPTYQAQPTFFYLHYMSSHSAGRHYAQYKKYSPTKQNLLTYVFPGLDDPNKITNSYDNQILQMDDMIKKSVSTLKNKGYMKNSIVVIYGDHGEALNEHGYFGHYHDLYQEEIHVPIIFKSSNNVRLKNTRLATLHDILPTVFNMASINMPENIEGESLLKEPQEKLTFHDSRKGIYAAVWQKGNELVKLRYNTKNNSKLLFDLINDPNEKNNIYSDKNLDAIHLLKSLKSYFNLS